MAEPIVEPWMEPAHRESAALLEMAVHDMTALCGGGFGGRCMVAALLLRRGVRLIRAELPAGHARVFVERATGDLLTPPRPGWCGRLIEAARRRLRAPAPELER